MFVFLGSIASRGSSRAGNSDKDLCDFEQIVHESRCQILPEAPRTQVVFFLSGVNTLSLVVHVGKWPSRVLVKSDSFAL